MLHHDLSLVFFLLTAMVLLFMLSQKLRISYPIFLVLGGLIIGFIPGTPHISLDPEVVFLLILPPLLFEAAWNTNWYDFWKFRRPISMLGFGLVFFTSVAVALFSDAYLPGFTLALGFLLGGIISPPDAVAATSVLKGVGMTKRGIVVLEGESLVNDAASLIVFRFALASILTGQFELKEAISDFFIVAFMGVLIGLLIGYGFYLMHRHLPTNAAIDTLLTLVAPYIMYIMAERFEFSGVLAVVSGGLFLSFRSADFLSYASRLQMRYVWETITFLLNGFVFILIGLQLPLIVEGLEDYSLKQAIFYGLLISIVAMVVRLIWIYPATYLPRWLSRRVRLSEKDPGKRAVFAVGWAGMRGVVSLASAFAIPLTLQDGSAFPHRNLILFITFIVILVTLVFQGLTLPLIIRFLKIQEDPYKSRLEQEAELNLRMSKITLAHLNKNYSEQIGENSRLQRLKTEMENIISNSEDSSTAERTQKHGENKQAFRKISLEVLNVRRKELNKIKREKKYDAELLKKYEEALDFDEAKFNS